MSTSAENVAENDRQSPADQWLRVAAEDGGLRVIASGVWTAAHAADIERSVMRIESRAAAARSIAIDAMGVQELDTYGAWLLERLSRGAAAQRIGAIAAPARFQAILDEVRATNTQSPAPPKTIWWRAQLNRLAGKLSEGVADLASLTAMFGAVSEALGRALMRPRSLRFTSLVNQLDRVGWQAVPIIVLITLLIGAIIAQQGFFHFRRFGADDYVVDLVGILILREIGVLLVAIMVAGRSGSAYTAELGSMKMREEIDALRTMGRDPIEVLILPRILALVISLPILTFLGGLAALYGGGVVAWLYGGMSPQIYIARLQEAISITHFQVGMIKAPFMALVIGAVACNEGLKVRGSAESLGLKTTTSVVKSIFLVIVLDGLFAVFFASIGM